MIHRNTREGDLHFGKYNGLGGKIDSGEDIVSGMRRELHEEANIEAEDLLLCGTISWPGFGRKGEDWFGFIFLIPSWSGTPLSSNPEGTLEWVSVQRLLALEVNLWPGDPYFLPLVFGDDAHQFHGVMPYKNGQPLSWSYSLVG